MDKKAKRLSGFYEEDVVCSGDDCGEPADFLVSRKDFVPVVSVEEFKKMKLDLLMKIHTLEAVISCQEKKVSVEWLKKQIEEVSKETDGLDSDADFILDRLKERLQAKKEVKKKNE